MRALAVSAALTLASACTCAARHDGDAPRMDAGSDASRLDAGARDAGFDAGFDFPDANLAATCHEALESPLGAPCAFDRTCLAGDLCCYAEVSCRDGRVRHARAYPDPCEGEVRPSTCLPSVATARGATPLGPVDFRYGYASFSFAFAVDVFLVFTSAETFGTCIGDRLGFWLLPHPDDPELGYIGVHDAIAQLVVGSTIRRVGARVEITRFVPPPEAPGGRIAGRFAIESPDPEWSLSGDFDICGCADLDRSGP